MAWFSFAWPATRLEVSLEFVGFFLVKFDSRLLALPDWI
jgi:hypothetical protein